MKNFLIGVALLFCKHSIHWYEYRTIPSINANREHYLRKCKFCGHIQVYLIVPDAYRDYNLWRKYGKKEDVEHLYKRIEQWQKTF